MTIKNEETYAYRFGCMRALLRALAENPDDKGLQRAVRKHLDKDDELQKRLDAELTAVLKRFGF